VNLTGGIKPAKLLRCGIIEADHFQAILVRDVAIATS